jgi:hypothetical protein
MPRGVRPDRRESAHASPFALHERRLAIRLCGLDPNTTQLFRFPRTRSPIDGQGRAPAIPMIVSIIRGRLADRSTPTGRKRFRRSATLHRMYVHQPPTSSQRERLIQRLSSKSGLASEYVVRGRPSRITTCSALGSARVRRAPTFGSGACQSSTLPLPCLACSRALGLRARAGGLTAPLSPRSSAASSGPSTTYGGPHQAQPRRRAAG